MAIFTKMVGFIAFFCLLLPSAGYAQMADFHTVPLPKEVKSSNAGNFELNEKTIITYPKGDKTVKRHAELLSKYIFDLTGLKLIVTDYPAQTRCIRITKALNDANPEAYRIRVNSEIIFLDGASDAGVFYAVQTLRKALPSGTAQKVIVPGTEVNDRPRFSYRGAHLDVSRHFVKPDSVLRFIDMLALHGINRLHWHLTDDQGWRVEIKKYPLLTKIGSHRDQTVIGHNSGRYDGIPYEGYYTQREIKDIVKYAADRHITIVPEIDLPGHMQAALAAYPELGCSGGPYKVWTMWGVSDSVLCAGTPKVYEFIKNVLTEITKLFPSEYIHVGGDECPKREWQKCPKCQAFIKENHLEGDGKHSAEERLQSHIISFAGRHLLSLGRKMIGWDEILEGGLAPGATVMSWRGEKGGIQAAKMGHDAIMTPNTYLYFDYYQSNDRKNEPLAIGGYLPIELTYSYEPMPASLSAEESKHIVGVQANCWTEYMPTFKQIEYMMLPRMAALSEIQWCAPEQKDFKDFMARLPRLIDHYRKADYNFSKVIYNVRIEQVPDTARRTLTTRLSTFGDAQIHYTLDGTEPTINSPKYVHPVDLKGNVCLSAAAFRGSEKSHTVRQDFETGLATACPLSLLKPANAAYKFSGPSQLNNGIKATDTAFNSGCWMGFSENDLEAVIDLGCPTKVTEIYFNTIVDHSNWIFDMTGCSVEGSTDGTTFTPLFSETYPQAASLEEKARISNHTISFNATDVRYLRVKIGAERNIPSWHWAAGKPGFLFVDEITVK